MLCFSGKSTTLHPFSNLAHPTFTNPSNQDATDQGATANDWASAVSVAIGGRAGGKAPVSIGNGTNPDKVDEGVALATEYLSKFKLS